MRQPVCDVVGGGLPVHGCIQRQDYFAHICGPGALHQPRDIEVVGAYAVEGGQGSPDHMITPPEDAGTLHRPKIPHLFHCADDGCIPARGDADGTRVHGVEIPALTADFDLGGRICERRRKRPQKLVAFFQQMQRRPASRARTEPGQFRQEVDQAEDFGAGGAVDHGRRCAFMHWT